MAMAFPVLLLLDLATDNPIHETDVDPYIAEEHRGALRPAPSDELRRRSVEDRCPRRLAGLLERHRPDGAGRPRSRCGGRSAPYYYIAGRAALPLFTQLGCELLGWADVTLINRRRSPAVWDVMHLRAEAPQPVVGPFFLEQRGLAERNESEGWVSVIVSTAPPRQDTEAALYMSLQDEPLAGVVRVERAHHHTDGPDAG